MYFSLGMGLFFLGAAVFIIVNPPSQPFIADNKYIVGIILFLYGLFRVYRAIRMIRGNKDMLN